VVPALGRIQDSCVISFPPSHDSDHTLVALLSLSLVWIKGKVWTSGSLPFGPN